MGASPAKVRIRSGGPCRSAVSFRYAQYELKRTVAQNAFGMEGCREAEGLLEEWLSAARASDWCTQRCQRAEPETPLVG
jgi:hypothetical protein